MSYTLVHPCLIQGASNSLSQIVYPHTDAHFKVFSHTFVSGGASEPRLLSLVLEVRKLQEV